LLLRDIINFMELSPSWEVASAQLLKNFPVFYGTRRFITVFTRALHWPLSWTISVHSIPPHTISLWLILILSSHLCLDLPSGLFPSGFPTKILYIFLSSPMRATCLVYFILHNLIILIPLGVPAIQCSQWRLIKYKKCVVNAIGSCPSINGHLGTQNSRKHIWKQMYYSGA
jgi:hypothetical protein